MSAVLVTLICLAIYALGYRFYAGYLSKRLFSLRPDAITPAALAVRRYRRGETTTSLDVFTRAGERRSG